MLEYVRLAMMRLVAPDVVRKIVVEPEVWWELVG